MSLLLLLRSPSTNRTYVISENTAHDFTGTDQLMIWGANPTTNYAGGVFRASTYNAAPDVRNSLLRAAMASLPSGGTITAIRVKLWQNSYIGSDPLKVIWGKRNWVKAEATYNIFSAGNSWAASGAITNTADGDPANPVSQAMSSANNGSYITLTMNAAIIANAQAAYNAGGNFNITLFTGDGVTGTGTEADFSRNTDIDGNRPIVEIDYQASTGALKFPSFLLMMLD